MKKRILAIIAVVLVLVFLAGCGDEVKSRTAESGPEIQSPQDSFTAEPSMSVTEESDQKAETPSAPAGTEDYCSDSDGGINQYQKGITRGILGGEPFRETDVCFDSKIIAETYCEGTELAMKYVKCKGECVFGECH